jgi:polyisoprenoid-binding protein YceI
MRLSLQDGSRVLIDLRATGLLRAVAHSPTLTARPERVTVDFGDAPIEGAEAAEATVEATFRADAIEAPADIPASDRAKMGDNLRGREVLDAARFPTVDFRGRYAGSMDAGTLAGELRVRSVARPVSMSIHVSRSAGVLVATGTWEGRLTELGIRPFKALLGAIKLEDWIALRLEASFSR